MDGEVGYGLWLLGGTVRPYAGASLLQGGGSTQRMGARLELGRGVQLELEGSRHEQRNQFIYTFVKNDNRTRLKCLSYKSPREALSDHTVPNNASVLPDCRDLCRGASLSLS